MDNRVIIKWIYCIGIASCAAQGAEKGKYENTVPLLHYVANAFGGGFMRDVILLGVPPWLFTLPAFPEITLVCITGYLYTHYLFRCKADEKWHRKVMQLVGITDALGLGSFICIGMDRAFAYSSNVFIIIACGYITAVGGGVLANGEPLTWIFKNKKTICYHLAALLGCCCYYRFKHALSVVCFTAIVLLLTNIDYRTLCHFYPCSLITASCRDAFLKYPAVCNKNNRFRSQKVIMVAKSLANCPRHSRIYLMQHRIRQC